MAAQIVWNDERLTLLPERAIWRPWNARLYIADLHFGKDASFRRYGIPVPNAVGQGDLDRLSTALEQTQPRCLVVLGDLLHAHRGMTPATHAAFLDWRERHGDLDIVLVRGNHDRNAGDPPAEWRITCVSEPYEDGHLTLRHEPPTDRAVDPHPALAGHLHPCVTLHGGGRNRLNLPCFWVQPHLIVLPAFTEFAGRPQISPAREDRVFVVGEDVVEVRLTA